MGALIGQFYVTVDNSDKTIVMGWGPFSNDIEADSFAYNKHMELDGKLIDGQRIAIKSSEDAYPEDPFDQGQFIRENNLPNNINTYVIDSVEYAEWNRGWCTANETLLEISKKLISPK